MAWSQVSRQSGAKASAPRRRCEHPCRRASRWLLSKIATRCTKRTSSCWCLDTYGKGFFFASVSFVSFTAPDSCSQTAALLVRMADSAAFGIFVQVPSRSRPFDCLYPAWKQLEQIRVPSVSISCGMWRQASGSCQQGCREFNCSRASHLWTHSAWRHRRAYAD